MNKPDNYREPLGNEPEIKDWMKENRTSRNASFVKHLSLFAGPGGINSMSAAAAKRFGVADADELLHLAFDVFEQGGM